MSPCPSCESVIQKVFKERQRLHQIVWDKACDHMLAALQTPVSTKCTHATVLTFLIQWINLTFFHGILASIKPTRYAVCSPACAADFHSRVQRFALNFESYAVPIRLIHVKHHAQLEAVSQCCNEAFQDLHCVPDFSMLIFTSLNETFFKNQLRMHRVRYPQVISAGVFDENRRFPNRELYRVWYNKVTIKELAFLRPPAEVKTEEDTHVEHEVSVQFLDNLFEE